MTICWLGLIPLTIWITACSTAQAQPQETGTLQGVVLDSETGKPLANATVNLQTLYHVYGRLHVASASSNGGGAFTIHAGANEYYFLSASKRGYLSGEAVPEPERFALDAGEKRTGLVLKLTREGVIRGHLTDADGDLVGRTGISVFQWRFAGGERYLARRNSGARVRPDGSFVIENLSPGTVYLQASRTWEFADYGDRPRMDQSLPTFYRNAADAASAEPIRIVPGVESGAIDLRMRRGLLYRVQGGTTGPAAMEQVAISLCAMWRQQFCLPAIVRPDGRFTLDNIPAGEYEIQGSALLRAPQPQSLRVSESVTVGDGLSDVRVALFPAPDVTTILHGGHGGFQLLSLPESSYAATLLYGNQESSRVPVYPGRYRVVALDLEEGKYVESIRSAARDVTDCFQLTTAGVTLDIILASGAAKLHGTARDGQGKPLEGVPVTVWTAGGVSGSARTTMSLEDGVYEFANLPPGEYRVAAWQGVSPGVAQYRGFFELFTNYAGSVKLASGQNREINPVAIGEKTAAAQLAKVR